MKENPCLFNKKLNDYKNIDKKVTLWQDKGDEMCVEVPLLKTWFESMRTRFGKLTKSKSGDGNIDHTERDQWILAHFNFLHTHIMRLRG